MCPRRGQPSPSRQLVLWRGQLLLLQVSEPTQRAPTPTGADSKQHQYPGVLFLTHRAPHSLAQYGLSCLTCPSRATFPRVYPVHRGGTWEATKRLFFAVSAKPKSVCHISSILVTRQPVRRIHSAAHTSTGASRHA